MFANKIFAFIATIMLLQSATQCSTQSLSHIRGKINLTAGWRPMVYLVQPRSFVEIASSFSGIVLDSASIAPDGSFVFSTVAQNDEPILLQIGIQKIGARFPNQLLDDDLLTTNYMPVVLQHGEQLEIAADADHFQATFSILKPSAENLALLQLRDIRQKAYTQQRHLMGAAEDHLDESMLLIQEEALRQFRLPLMAFADSSSFLWPALVAVRWVSPAGDYERVPEFIFGQCQKWREKNIASPWIEQLCQSASRERLPVLTGDVIQDYPLPMAKGDTSFLHTLLGSRLTVLDIWASWCMPCRRENREVLLPLWTQYHDQGLQILGYSIDSSPGAWHAAVVKDGAVWPHASHLSGDATPFLETLRITTIPANFILNAQGVIVAKNLHGEALQAFVTDYMNRY